MLVTSDCVAAAFSVLLLLLFCCCDRRCCPSGQDLLNSMWRFRPTVHQVTSVLLAAAAVLLLLWLMLLSVRAGSAQLYTEEYTHSPSGDIVPALLLLFCCCCGRRCCPSGQDPLNSIQRSRPTAHQVPLSLLCCWWWWTGAGAGGAAAAAGLVWRAGVETVG